MPDSSSSTATSSSTEETDFGANDWLLEEMYEQYKADPNSVDQAWVTYFKEHGAPGGAEPAAQPAAKPAPATKLAAATKPAAAGSAGGTNGHSTAKAPSPQPAPRPAPAAAPAAKETTSRPNPTVERPSTNKEGRPATPGSRGGVPADPPNPAVRPDVALEAPVRTTLRGAPARTAKNMDLSLTVPTATSVRSLPVKLLIDQRVVINNHLRRSRGGKVSYTHLIGYAMVQALKSVPAMNNGYEVVDGKPTLIVPAHVNLG